MSEPKTHKAVLAALDAADIMFSEFMDATCSISEQIPIYKTAHAKVKAARKLLQKEYKS